MRGGQRFSRSSVGLLLMSLSLQGCGGRAPVVKPEPKLNRWGKPLKEGTPAPSWIDRVPDQTKTRYYAVGTSAPTFWPQDSLGNASEDARGKLALELSAHYEVLGESVERASSGNGGDSLKQVDITKAATDLVVQNSRIESTWTDESGVRGEAGTTWALAVLDTGAARGGAVDSNGSKQGNNMPGWLDRLPSSSGRIYAAGYSGPTFQSEAALDYAGDAAIDNLCSTLRSHVQAYTLLVETGSGLSVDEFSKADDPDAAFKELVKKSARVDAVWVDEQGARPGDPPGSVWALAGIDVNNAKGGYNTLQNADTGPALDAHGNIPAGVTDAKSGAALKDQAAAQAAAAQKATQDKAAQQKQAVDAHNADVKQGVQTEQAKYKEETKQATPAAK